MRQEDHSVKITIEGKLVDEDCLNAASCTFKVRLIDLRNVIDPHGILCMKIPQYLF
jgi:hypothetical protein